MTRWKRSRKMEFAPTAESLRLKFQPKPFAISSWQLAFPCKDICGISASSRRTDSFPSARSAPANCQLLIAFRALLTLALETVAAFALSRHCFHYFEERSGGVGKIGVLAVDQAQFSFQLQLANRDAHQFSPG